MKWQPIETAPKDGTLILLWAHDIGCRNDRVTVGYFGSKPIGAVSYNGEKATEWRTVEEENDDPYDPAGTSPKYITPTHWMPLPEPPK